MARSPDFWGVVVQGRGRRRNPLRLTPGRTIFVAAAVGLLWSIGAYISGDRTSVA